MLYNSIDISILAILILALVWGGFKGAIQQVASLCGVVFGIVVARLYYEEVGQWLNNLFAMSDFWQTILSVSILFLLVLTACTLIGKLADGFFSSVGVGWINRCIGAGFSVGQWVLILSLALNIAELAGVHTWESCSEPISTSRLYSPIKKAVPTLFPYFTTVIQTVKTNE